MTMHAHGNGVRSISVDHERQYQFLSMRISYKALYHKVSAHQHLFSRSLMETILVMIPALWSGDVVTVMTIVKN